MLLSNTSTWRQGVVNLVRHIENRSLHRKALRPEQDPHCRNSVGTDEAMANLVAGLEGAKPLEARQTRGLYLSYPFTIS